ncbi:right-handed parallel beta-helix repeat-containing protein [Pedobacter sp. PWIIR3]
MNIRLRPIYSILLLLLLCSPVFGQRVLHVAVTGNDNGKGTPESPFRTISMAAKIARGGDEVRVHQGIYRERVDPSFGGTSNDKRVIYSAAKGERVQIKGSEIMKGWKKTIKGNWQLIIPDSFFGAYNPYKVAIYGDWFFPSEILHTGEVFLDGKVLVESNNGGSLTWSATALNDSTRITADFSDKDPNVAIVEITVRESCFYPSKTGVNYITVKGFELSQAATQWAAPTAEQVGLIGTNWSKGWMISGNTVSDSKCVGITLGKDRASGQNPWSANMSIDGSVLYNQVIEKAILSSNWNKAHVGGHEVSGNTIFNCGAAGICGSLGAVYSSILDNNIYDVYTRRNFTGAEMAGIKIHGAIDVLISGNRIRNSFIGIWLDWMAQGTRITRNLMYDNDYVDFFPEVNHGPYLVDNNLFLSDFSLRDWSEGGAYAHNYFAGIITRAPQERKTPYFKPHTTEIAGLVDVKGGDNRFYNNVFLMKSDILKYVQPKMHAYDQMDSLRSYGLSVYDHSVMPVIASGNLLLNRVKVESSVNNELPRRLINTDQFGKAIVPVQSFTGLKGKGVLLNTDFFGKKRTEKKLVPGPFADGIIPIEKQIIPLLK